MADFGFAPRYLGMDREPFSDLLRPHLSEIPIGRHEVTFDRLELDTWAREDHSKWQGGKCRGSLHYLAAELQELIDAAERACGSNVRKMPALTLTRKQAAG